MSQPTLFNVIKVPLKGSNLIEASAGTGKTYSIAILVVRLIVEEKLSIKEILMVTFTKAAVAELEERIRLFIRLAYKVNLGETIQDETITKIVHEQTDKQLANKLLKEAVLFLDETSVLTIHSFCQKTLNEFAFETNQLFGAETLKDTGAVIEAEINKFWRQQVTAMPIELLRKLLETGFSRQRLKELFKSHLAGKKYAPFQSSKNYELCVGDHKAFLVQLTEQQAEKENIEKVLPQYVTDNFEALKIIAESNSIAKKNLIPLLQSPEAFLNYIIEKRGSGYIIKLFSELLVIVDECNAKLQAIKNNFQEIVSAIICFAIQQIVKGIEAHKQRSNQMSFDDMIVKLHHALQLESSGSLVTELQKKYKAVFVDEFQDTDRLQYEIFQKAFSTNTILFYIGDPKQSIYAFRKADIFTYFKAYDAVDHMFDMNQNFRSSAPMINAMNLFFKPAPAFDTFHFKEAAQAIQYNLVESPAVNTKGLLEKDGEALVPITITLQPNNNSINEAVSAQVIDLLENNHYHMVDTKQQRKITPAAIGILVKTNKQGREIKNMFASLGIPAVTIGDDKVLQTAEASYLLYLLEAINEISRAHINKALLSPFTGFTKENILYLDDEKVLAIFNKYKYRWEQVGVYTALMDFVTDFNVQQQLLQYQSENGERSITNLYHLIELVHKVQTSKMLSPIELISWLKRAVEGMETEGDEYEQRVDNDEEAVNIVTIHKSKGLEYKIVIAPYLDLVGSTQEIFRSFRDDETGEYIVLEKVLMTDRQSEMFADQQEQEFRRLVYVAITRAVYKCFIYKSVHFKRSTLSTFVDAFENVDNTLIELTDEALIIPDNYQYTNQQSWEPLTVIENVSFVLLQQNWTKMSYTMLAAKNEQRIKSTGLFFDDPYNQFVFQQLAKGEKTGNMLHGILETINYSNSEKWDNILGAAITRFAPGQRSLYQKMLPQMLLQILQATIQLSDITFKLEDIAFHKRIHELEFDFPVASLTPTLLNDISDEAVQMNVKLLGNLEGIMNGKIDLFFEHNGKYFILDWKSNYLGNTLEHYNATALAAAMNESNYHLQYMIYSIAVKKYLKNRLPGFDYEKDFGGVIYLFLRGVRKGSDTGMFLYKPMLDKIEKISDSLSESALAAY